MIERVVYKSRPQALKVASVLVAWLGLVGGVITRNADTLQGAPYGSGPFGTYRCGSCVPPCLSAT